MRQLAQLYPDEMGKQPVSPLPWDELIRTATMSSTTDRGCPDSFLLLSSLQISHFVKH